MLLKHCVGRRTGKRGHVNVLDDVGHESSHVFAGLLNRVQHLFMRWIDMRVTGALAPIGDEGQTQDGKATMGGHNDFGHGGLQRTHTYPAEHGQPHHTTTRAM
jgi:hypothetical protein